MYWNVNASRSSPATDTHAFKVSKINLQYYFETNMFIYDKYFELLNYGPILTEFRECTGTNHSKKQLCLLNIQET